MYYFKIMCETVHQQGGTLMRKIRKGAKENAVIDNVLSREFVLAAKVCEPFVFSPLNEAPKDLEEVEVKGSIDAPFKCFSIEVAGQPLSTSRFEVGEPQVDVECIMIYEVDPSSYLIYTMYNVKGERYVFSTALQLDHGNWVNLPDAKDTDTVQIVRLDGNEYLVDDFILKLIQAFIMRLSVQSEGMEKVNDRVTVRSAGHKEIIKIKRVIHIAPKKIRDSYQNETQREIDWSQAWFVRGHWRCFWSDKESQKIDLTKMGKDRSGNYCVPGRTWVSEYRKGPEDLVPTPKTRIVSS